MSTIFSSVSATVAGIAIVVPVVYFYLGKKMARKPSPTAIPAFVENSSKPIVIYVHGLYGCYLSNKTNKNDNNNKVIEKSFELPSTIFKSFFSGNNGHANLALPITWNSSSSISASDSANDNDDGNDNILQQDIDDIYPSDDFKIGHPELIQFLDELNENNLIELHKIRWDWRRSFEDSEKLISSKIQAICSSKSSATTTTGTSIMRKKATILTHSTGSLLSWPSINKHPEWFSSWINVGGAVISSNVLLHEMKNSWKVPGILGKVFKLLSKEALFTFPSQYGFFRVLPHEPFIVDYESEFIEVQKGSNDEKFITNEDSIDLYNIDHWEQFKLGIYSWKEHGTVTEEEKEHLKNCLETSKRFRMKHFVRPGKPDGDDSFLDNDRKAYDHLDIVCYGTEAFDTHVAYEINLEHNKVDTSESKLMTKGDGTVRNNGWKHVYGGLNKRIVFAEENSTHVSMCNDLKLRKVCLESFFPSAEQREYAEQKCCKN